MNVELGLGFKIYFPNLNQRHSHPEDTSEGSSKPLKSDGTS